MKVLAVKVVQMECLQIQKKPSNFENYDDPTHFKQVENITYKING